MTHWQDEIPSDLLQQALLLQELLIARATGGPEENSRYSTVRSVFWEQEALRGLLPDFVQRHRSLGTFWPFIKDQFQTYAERRAYIAEAFLPLLDYLEGRGRGPDDARHSETLRSFDAEGVHQAWAKALARRDTDPDGAITSARTLLETVIKRILTEREIPYCDSDDLPRLYRNAASALNLAPDQHAQAAVKSILGGVTSVVEGLGTLRNKLSDAHGRASPVRAQARHATLAVNMAGTVATFLVETHHLNG